MSTKFKVSVDLVILAREDHSMHVTDHVYYCWIEHVIQFNNRVTC